MLMKKKQTGSQDKLIDEKIRRAQFKHLIELANHEQRVVLQPLCWNKPKLRSAMELMRNPIVSIAAPDLKLVLTEHQNSQDSRFVSTPSDKEVLEKMPRTKQRPNSVNQHIQYIPSGPVPFEVENVEYRMIWIGHPIINRCLSIMPRQLAIEKASREGITCSCYIYYTLR